MFKIVEIWDDDDIVEMDDFDTYQEAFDIYVDKFHYGILPMEDFLIVDMSTGEVVFQASIVKMI